MTLQIQDLRFSYGSHEVLRGIDLEMAPGEITAVLGPNAAGKSTLLKCIAGLLNSTGTIRFDGKNLSEYSFADLTRQLCYLPQEVPVNAVLTVFEAVLLARKQTSSWRVAREDLTSVARTLENLHISDLAERFLNELSGGQKQMVSIAQALVRNPRVLLLDEPTSSLDLQHQIEVFELVQQITILEGIVTLVAVHDLNLAARFASAFVIMKDGTKYSAGKAVDVLTPETIRAVYNVNVRIDFDEHDCPSVFLQSSARTPKPSDLSLL